MFGKFASMNEDKVLSIAETDFDILEKYFGVGYFVLFKIKKGVLLLPYQKQELLYLLEERNHFEILCFVNNLRKGNTVFSVS